jgi:hypothetical protein
MLVFLITTWTMVALMIYYIRSGMDKPLTVSTQYNYFEDKPVELLKDKFMFAIGLSGLKQFTEATAFASVGDTSWDSSITGIKDYGLFTASLKTVSNGVSKTTTDI